MKTMVRGGALTCLLLAGTCLTAPALAQSAQIHRQPDANGVDVTYGDFLMSAVEGSIGSGEGELALVRNSVWVGSGYNVNGHQWDRISFTRTPHSGGTFDYSITVGARYESFTGTGTLASGSSLSGSDNDFVYRTSDGTTIEFTDAGVGGPDMGSNFCTGESGQGWCTLLPTAIGQPDGKTVTIAWNIWSDCTGEIGVDFSCHFTPRIGSIANSFGYEIHFAYSSDGNGPGGDPPTSWFQRTGATFHNNSVSGNPSQASVSYAYPSTGVTQVTDIGGNVWRFTGTLLGVTGIRRPGAGSDTTTIAYSSGPVVSSVTREGVTTGYSRSVSGSTATETITDAASHVTTVVSNLTVGRPTSVTDPLSRQTQYQYDSDGRLTRVTAPEGNYVQYTYDSRGNVTETRRVAKAGSGLSDIVTSATYASSCSDPSCNEPLTTTDERGYVTDYTYDTTHGGVLTVTAPAPSGSGTRPQTRYTYTLTNGEYRLTGVSTCASGDATSGCLGGTNEATTAIAYDANGNTTSVTRDNGASGLTSATAATYDPLGNLLTVDGPIAGSDDTIRYRYNAARQPVGVVGPDPDGGGSLHHRAQRTTYTYGLPTRAETGTVNSQSDGDWASFSSLEQVDITYDANARPTRRALSASSTTYAVTDMSYDALGRPDCTAVRMNSSAWGTTTAACTHQSAGSYGADRITRTSYDNASQVTLVQTGYGVTGVQADEVAAAYSDNGQVLYVTDANGNISAAYQRDGHDRPWITYYPNASGGGINWSDYEIVGHDATGNITSRQNRDGSVIYYVYDHLNRLTAKDLPGSELDVTLGYDLMNRMTSAAASGGQTLSFTFDALGRNLTQVGPRGTVSYAYDSAGRRTSMTYADSGLVVGYTYDIANDLTVITENPSGSSVALGTYAYDNRGRRTSLTRGNGAVTSYTYDNVDRLTQIAEDFTGGATYDRHVDYTLDPAGGIAGSTGSSDSYAWTGHYAINRSYTANGLNQYTAAGSITPTYDSRGNVTSAGSVTYGYSSENRLTSATGGITLSYDPLGRLYETVGAATTRMGYDGLQMIAEYNSSNALQRRYVYGPGTDELLVWYEGTDTSTRHYHHTDERGSVIALSNNSGALTDINRYDEYGIPGTNAGRFQYTGQQWLSDLGMYYYRNRIYSPTLGRFLQTDPIGLGGGMNLYAYVGNNPVNFTDPSGTTCYKTDYYWSSRTNAKVNLGPAGAEVFCDPPATGDLGRPVVQFPSNQTDLPGGGEMIPASGGTPPASPPSRPSSCSRALNETGRVVQVYVNVNAGSGLGVTGAAGYFFNWDTGTHGYFVSIGGLLGGELDVGGGVHIWRSLADMHGFSDSVHAALDPAQGSVTLSDILNDRSFIGGGAGASFGAGLSGSRSYTFIFWCSYE